MRNKGQQEKHKLYQQIIKSIQPIIKKFGRENVRLALNRWETIEREKKNLTIQIAESKKRLAEL